VTSLLLASSGQSSWSVRMGSADAAWVKSHVQVIPSSSPAAWSTAAAIRCPAGRYDPDLLANPPVVMNAVRQSLYLNSTTLSPRLVERGRQHRDCPAGLRRFVHPNAEGPLLAVRFLYSREVHRPGSFSLLS
jgi:hypothetical protein